MLSLRALGIKHGDLVAVPAHTFIATWNAVITVGATPIGVDVDSDGLIDLEKFSQISGSVKAVIPVHMHGTSVDMKALAEVCKSPNLREKIKIVEDASQAHGFTFADGSCPGRYSDTVVYSLYPTKNLGALGDAGVVTTNDTSLDQKLRSLINYGSRKDDKYYHESLGFNSRLDPIQASILMRNLVFLEQWNKSRVQLSEFYIKELAGGFEFLQERRKDSVRHHLCILTNQRESLRGYLKSKNIGTEIHYPRVAGVEASEFLGKKVFFSQADKIARSSVSLPLSQWHSMDQVDYVIENLKNWKKM